MSTSNACVLHGALDCADCYPDLRRRNAARIQAYAATFPKPTRETHAQMAVREVIEYLDPHVRERQKLEALQRECDRQGYVTRPDTRTLWNPRNGREVTGEVLFGNPDDALRWLAG